MNKASENKFIKHCIIALDMFRTKTKHINLVVQLMPSLVTCSLLLFCATYGVPQGKHLVLLEHPV